MSVERPYLSVIVPVHQSMAPLRICLAAILANDLPRGEFELIVIDDASTDETSLVASEYADVVVRLAGKPHGPAFARNRGYESSRGAVCVFIDSDVVIHADALRRITAHMRGDEHLAGVFGSYDNRPAAPQLVSQYRNLLHHYVHHRNAGPAETFWAGIGALRADLFGALGMFDEWTYGRPQIEDIELGRRIRRSGSAILLDPAIQGTHLKRWTLMGTLKADFQHRGVPWMWLLIQEGAPEESRALNVRLIERVCTVMVFAAIVMPVAGAVMRESWPLLVGLSALIVALVLNARFYAFLTRARGWAFLLGAVPLHLLYYFGNTLSAATGWVVHHLFGEPVPPADVSAHAQLGVQTWPPPPRRPTSGVWSLPQDRPRSRP